MIFKGLLQARARTVASVATIGTDYGWLGLWHPEVLACIGIIAYLYQKMARSVTFGQRILFWAMLMVLYVAMGTPMKLIADDYLLTAHMVQYVLMSMVVPPLLILGIPGVAWRRLWTITGLSKIWRWLSYPPVALIGFNVAFSVLQYPPILDMSLRNTWAYLVLPYVILILSIAMWWPMLSPLEEFPRLSRGAQLIYLFFNVDFMMPSSVYIVDTSRAEYRVYQEAPRLFHLSALADQQLGGVVMGVGMFLAYAVAFGIIYAGYDEGHWYD